MRHKTVAQKGEGGGWHYVNLGKRGGHPIGYCDGHDPHPTADEARECYSRFVREQTIRLDWCKTGWTSCRVPDCPHPTQGMAAYGDDGYGVLALCPDHMTVADVISVAQLDRPAGDAWLS